jgi:uncharacterized protein (TIGR02246 family)
MNRRHFLAASSCAAAASASAAAAVQAPPADIAAVRQVVQKYVDAREASDPKAIEVLFTPDADQLVSDGTWRKGRDLLVKGMLESSKRNPAKRTIEVESVRFLTAEVALTDGRYILKGQAGSKDRVMWTSIALQRRWRIGSGSGQAGIKGWRPHA